MFSIESNASSRTLNPSACQLDRVRIRLALMAELFPRYRMSLLSDFTINVSINNSICSRLVFACSWTVGYITISRNNVMGGVLMNDSTTIGR